MVANFILSPATPDRNPTEYCWKTTREEVTSIKSFKNIKILREELDEFWEKNTFNIKVTLFKTVTIDQTYCEIIDFMKKRCIS